MSGCCVQESANLAAQRRMLDERAGAVIHGHRQAGMSGMLPDRLDEWVTNTEKHTGLPKRRRFGDLARPALGPRERDAETNRRYMQRGADMASVMKPSVGGTQPGTAQHTQLVADLQQLKADLQSVPLDQLGAQLDKLLTPRGGAPANSGSDSRRSAQEPVVLRRPRAVDVSRRRGANGGFL